MPSPSASSERCFQALSAPRTSLVWWQKRGLGRAARARVVLLLAGVTCGFAALLGWAVRSLDPEGPARALAIVWLPMTWLGTVSHHVGVKLPERCHALRRFERGGRVYEWLGVRVVKRLLRRGPFALFNPGLHLPQERTREQLAALELRMKTAETTHFILLVLTLAAVAHAAWRGSFAAAGYTLLFDVAVNGYPVMLQRYNRALLRQRFESTPP